MPDPGPGPMPQVCRPARPNTPPNQRKEKPPAEPTESYWAKLWAQYEKYGKEPAPPAPKPQILLRIGVFFDGTGNNAANTLFGELCGAQHHVKREDLDTSCKPYMADPDSSYGNDITNIRKLSALYPSESNEEEKRAGVSYYRIYVDGIGTTPGEKDNIVGAGTGRGETGVASRVHDAFTQIKALIRSFSHSDPDSEISHIIFDAFGFSRGAAAARHFANELVYGRNGPLGPILNDNSRALSKRFDDKYGRNITTGFIGLFDTVASVAGLLNLGNVSSAITPGLKLHLDPGYFSKVVQLAARDEYRSNFALSSVSPDHSEITLPGAHSDIGGGYLVDAQECVLVSPMQALTVRQGVDIRSTSIYQDALQVKAQMVAQGWPAAMLEVVTPSPVTLPANPQDRLAPKQQRVFAALQLKRQVRGELSRVYLRVMHKLAKENGVPLADIDPNDPNYAIPSELQAITDRFVAGDYSTSGADESLLKERYIHRSGHWNNPLKSITTIGFRLLYVNAPRADGIRIKHPHVAAWKL